MRRSLVVLLGLVLAGCENTGGTVLGLFPAPKLLSGSVDDDVYTAKDGCFTVAVPHTEESSEYTYMTVKEQQGGPGEWYVSFGPAAMDQSIYRIEVARGQDQTVLAANFERAFDAWIEHTRSQVEAAYGGSLALESKSDDPVAGHPARTRKYTQQTEPGKYYSNQSEQLNHEVIALNLGTGAAFVWVQQDGGVRAGLSAQQFAASVRMP